MSLRRVDAGELAGRTYYLSPSGSDAGSGTKGAPWASLDKACRQAEAGDTVILLPGAYSGLLRPVNSGTEEAPITFLASARRQVVLTGVNAEDYAVEVKGVEHIRLEGFEIRPQSMQGRWLIVESARHIELHDLLMERAFGGMPFLITDSDQVRLTDSVLREYYGNNMARVSNSSHVLIEANSITRAGHCPLQFYPIDSNRYVTLRANVFHPAWGRPFALHTVRSLLMEGNIITNGLNGGRSNDSMGKLLMSESIVRFNRIFRNWGGPVSSVPYLPEHAFRNVRIYHNVFDDNAKFGFLLQPAQSQMENVLFVNNIFSRNDKYGVGCQVSFRTIPNRDAVRFYFNVITSPEEGADTIRFNGHPASLSNADHVAWNQGADGVFVKSLDLDPKYHDAVNYSYGLASDSPLRDAGKPLTTAVGTGYGQVLPVEDASYFYDGFGIDGEQGDVIRVGEETPSMARLVHVDTQASTLTLDRLVAWTDGAPVSLPWAGSAPDIAVWETGEAAPTSLQIEIVPFETKPGTPVQMRVVMGSMPTPVKVFWHLGDGQVAEGTEVTHVYNRPYDYPVRVRASDATGRSYVGAGYVVVEEERGKADPLFHSTFDVDDMDWWWYWHGYRPMPAAYERVLDGAADREWPKIMNTVHPNEGTNSGNGWLKAFAPEPGSIIPLRVHPVGWDLDRYPVLYLRYKVTASSPVGFYLVAFPTESQESRRLLIAATDSNAKVSYRLENDGKWHDLFIDARAIRKTYPGVQVLEGLHLESMAPDQVATGDSYALDEMAILPLDALVSPLWQGKVSVSQLERLHDVFQN